MDNDLKALADDLGITRYKIAKDLGLNRSSVSKAFLAKKEPLALTIYRYLMKQKKSNEQTE